MYSTEFDKNIFWLPHYSFLFSWRCFSAWSMSFWRRFSSSTIPPKAAMRAEVISSAVFSFIVLVLLLVLFFLYSSWVVRYLVWRSASSMPLGLSWSSRAVIFSYLFIWAKALLSSIFFVRQSHPVSNLKHLLLLS